MSRNGWKQLERDVAAALGGERVGPSGRATCDVVVPAFDAGPRRFAVECKERKDASWPLVERALAQANGSALSGGYPFPVVVVKRSAGRGRPTPTLVVMHLDTLAALASAEGSPA